MNSADELLSSFLARPPIQMAVIGASAGAVDALSQILKPLPANYPLALVIVVHLPPDRDSRLAELFQQMCALHIREVEDKTPLLPGTVYFAPPDYHVLVEDGSYLSLSNEEPVNCSRPAIDVLFSSAADVYGDKLMGILLTGANHDGAAGCRAVEAAGGVVIVQDPTEATSSTMPAAAAAACSHPYCLRLNELAEVLVSLGLNYAH